MTVTPALTVLEGGRRAGWPLAESAPSPPSGLTFDSVSTVEIVAPDRHCAALLLDHAAPRFPAEIVSDPEWVVRFRLPATSRDWVVELLALIETWLQAAPLPCAKVRHGDNDYLVRAPNKPARTALVPWEAA
jgi:hypothetical protein